MQLVVELDAAGAAEHDVDLLLLSVTVTARAAPAGGIAEVADADVLRADLAAGEAGVKGRASLDGLVLELQEVDDRVIGQLHPPSVVDCARSALPRTTNCAVPPCRDEGNRIGPNATSPRASLIEDEAEEVQAADECQRDRAEQEARRPRPDPEADSDRCDSDDQRAHLADPNQHRAGADEPRP